MVHTSKFCDAADWFRPEIQEIISNELRELSRFHRKQWEFAMIFLCLRLRGMLLPGRVALSMGGGKERVLYAIANHVAQLTVTDLYAPETPWDCARTDDPNIFIKTNTPFPADVSRVNALRMDMRDLQFPDNSFDFCYSTCAVEHIGDRRDFLEHFNEVHRVLKEGGIYVFTTEVGFDDRVIEDPNNFVFSLPFLRDLFSETDLSPDEDFDTIISPHRVNFPTLSSLKTLAYAGPDHGMYAYFDAAPHIQLLRGKHPFTCGLFVLRKGGAKRGLSFLGLEESRRFVETGVAEFRRTLVRSRFTLDPYAGLPGKISRFFADHAQFFSGATAERGDDETPFHTEYVWYGSGERTFQVTLVGGQGEEVQMEILVHRYRSLSSREVECVSRSVCQCTPRETVVQSITIPLDDDYCYAILAKRLQGWMSFDRIEVTTYPGAGRDVQAASKKSLQMSQAE